MRAFYVVAAVLVLMACTNTNKVSRIESATGSEVKAGERFNNLYTGKQTYPVTCEQDCYPPSEAVNCELEAEKCQFVGVQSKPNC